MEPVAELGVTRSRRVLAPRIWPSLIVVANRRLATFTNGNLVYWRQSRASLNAGAYLARVRRQSEPSQTAVRTELRVELRPPFSSPR